VVERGSDRHQARVGSDPALMRAEDGAVDASDIPRSSAFTIK